MCNMENTLHKYIRTSSKMQRCYINLSCNATNWQNTVSTIENSFSHNSTVKPKRTDSGYFTLIIVSILNYGIYNNIHLNVNVYHATLPCIRYFCTFECIVYTREYYRMYIVCAMYE